MNNNKITHIIIHAKNVAVSIKIFNVPLLIFISRTCPIFQ